MLKEYLKKKEISLYKLAKVCDLPYSTLNDIVNHKVDISNIRAGIVYKISRELDMTMDELYDLCTTKILIHLDKYCIDGTVLIKNKKYILEFDYYGEIMTSELCSVKKEASMFIETIALWEMEKMVADYERLKMYELCLKTQR